METQIKNYSTGRAYTFSRKKKLSAIYLSLFKQLLSRAILKSTLPSYKQHQTNMLTSKLIPSKLLHDPFRKKLATPLVEIPVGLGT